MPHLLRYGTSVYNTVSFNGPTPTSHLKRDSNPQRKDHQIYIRLLWLPRNTVHLNENSINLKISVDFIILYILWEWKKVILYHLSFGFFPTSLKSRLRGAVVRAAVQGSVDHCVMGSNLTVVRIGANLSDDSRVWIPLWEVGANLSDKIV
jgi:hypothetical protein